MPKYTQAQVAYRRGWPFRQCGTCKMYSHGADAEQFGGCIAVTGNITSFGYCDLYDGLRNPYGNVLNRAERVWLENWFDHHRVRKGLPR